MIKPIVGQVRKQAYPLPNTKNPQHVYGYEVKRDDEDAGQVLNKWVQTIPSKAALSKRSFVATNKLALAAGCVSPKANREFANQNTNIRVQAVRSEKKNGRVSNSDVTFGIRTVESENMTGLIQAKHTHFSYSDSDYPDLSTMNIKGKLPLPRETKASLGKDCRYHQHIEKQPFKMKKFDKVKGVMSTQPQSKPRQGQEPSVERISDQEPASSSSSAEASIETAEEEDKKDQDVDPNTTELEE